MIKNLDKLALKLQKLDAVACEQAMEQACLRVERDAKKNCPSDDGTLRNSITHEVVYEDGTLIGAVGSNVEYAPYVHQGTGIYAVNGDGRKDRWSYQDDKGVWHSTIGQRPQPFLLDALDQNKDKIDQLFVQAIKESAK